jgi:hypothetical protein
MACTGARTRVAADITAAWTVAGERAIPASSSNSSAVRW